MQEKMRNFTEEESVWLERALKSCYNTKWFNIIGVRPNSIMSDDDIQIAPSFDHEYRGSIFGTTIDKPLEFVILTSYKNEHLGNELYRRITKLKNSQLYRTLNGQ